MKESVLGEIVHSYWILMVWQFMLAKSHVYNFLFFKNELLLWKLGDTVRVIVSNLFKAPYITSLHHSCHIQILVLTL